MCDTGVLFQITSTVFNRRVMGCDNSKRLIPNAIDAVQSKAVAKVLEEKARVWLTGKMGDAPKKVAEKR